MVNFFEDKNLRTFRFQVYKLPALQCFEKPPGWAVGISFVPCWPFNVSVVVGTLFGDVSGADGTFSNTKTKIQVAFEMEGVFFSCWPYHPTNMKYIYIYRRKTFRSQELTGAAMLVLGRVTLFANYPWLDLLDPFSTTRSGQGHTS